MGTDVCKTLSLLTHSHLRMLSLPRQISLSKPSTASPDPLTITHQVGASIFAASCLRICWRSCCLSSLPLKPSPFVIATSEAIAVRLCPLYRFRAEQPLLALFIAVSLKGTYKVWDASLEWPRAGIGYELRAFEAKLQRRRQELTQATPDQSVDDEAVYYNVAGECPKGRVYGLESLGRKNRRYADPDASTSQLPEMVPRSEFDSVVEQLRHVVVFMQRQFGITIDEAGLSRLQPPPPPLPPPHEQQQQPPQIDPADLPQQQDNVHREMQAWLTRDEQLGDT
ncbi:hypothetical protein Syun_001481 [Stephania yunnanensis]|uniref:Uncharacterized protein n=1 Tax=Stephania yunnanensis TaxID=152371 RepID=A0AAP0LE03_9MAGN